MSTEELPAYQGRTPDERPHIDIYDREIEYLTNHPEEIPVHWGKPSPLFGFATVDPFVAGIEFGCLSMIRGSREVAETEELTVAIRADERIPGDPDDITVEHLPAFAEWQRKLNDQLKREVPVVGFWEERPDHVPEPAEVVQAIRQIVRERPNVAYLGSANYNGGKQCLYTKGDCTDGTCGCLVGQGLLRAGLVKSRLEKVDVHTYGVRGCFSVLGVDTGALESQNPLRWLDTLQSAQDDGLSWEQAVQTADEV